jgi:hypothetical protein
MWKQIFIIICVSIIIYASVYSPKKVEYFNEQVAVMPNEFIQTNNQNGANNIDNSLFARFLPDNMDLTQFFKFDTDSAKFFPDSNKIINKYYKVPLSI